MKILILAAAWSMMTFMPLHASTTESDSISDGPGIYVNKATFDFGDIDNDKSVTHTFIVSNDGNEPLVINSVYSSCGCTTSEYSKEPIAPGKSTTIAVTFNPIGRPAGFFTKVVRIKSNARGKALKLYVKGRVRR